MDPIINKKLDDTFRHQADIFLSNATYQQQNNVSLDPPKWNQTLFEGLLGKHFHPNRLRASRHAEVRYIC